jgi:hypothetical protein
VRITCTAVSINENGESWLDGRVTASQGGAIAGRMSPYGRWVSRCRRTRERVETLNTRDPVPAEDILELGPCPAPTTFPRWVRRAVLPNRSLAPVTSYECLRLGGELAIDGRVDGQPWPWSDPFTHIADGSEVPHESRVALLWDDTYLYAAFDIVDPDRECIATEPGSHIYIWDTDAELFILGPAGYYEVGVNSIGTKYELLWSNVERLVRSNSFAELEELFKLPNFLYITSDESNLMGRVGDLDYRLPGLQHEEQWSQRADGPGWTVEMALPWESLGPAIGMSEWPPKDGSELQIQAYRAFHPPSDPAAVRAMVARHGDGASPFEGWTWSIQGNGNVHIPERWSRVGFSSKYVDES